MKIIFDVNDRFNLYYYDDLLFYHNWFCDILNLNIFLMNTKFLLFFRHFLFEI